MITKAHAESEVGSRQSQVGNACLLHLRTAYFKIVSQHSVTLTQLNYFHSPPRQHPLPGGINMFSHLG